MLNHKKNFSIFHISFLKAKDAFYLSYKSSKSPLWSGVVDSVVQLSSTKKNPYYFSTLYELIKVFQCWKQNLSINNVKCPKISPSTSLQCMFKRVNTNLVGSFVEELFCFFDLFWFFSSQTAQTTADSRKMPKTELQKWERSLPFDKEQTFM